MTAIPQRGQGKAHLLREVPMRPVRIRSRALHAAGFAVVVAGLTTGCAIAAYTAVPEPGGQRTLLVQNYSLDPVTVYVAGQRIGWVEPQQAACLAFPWDDAPVEVRVHAVGRDVRHARIAPVTQPGWRLIVYNPGNAQQTELFGTRDVCANPGTRRVAAVGH